MLQKYVQEEEGSFTLEAAYIVPLVIGLICALLLGTVSVYKRASEEIAEVKARQEGAVRKPAAVIRNTDLAMEYFEKWKDALEEKS